MPSEKKKNRLRFHVSFLCSETSVATAGPGLAAGSVRGSWFVSSAHPPIYDTRIYKCILKLYNHSIEQK